MAVSRAGRTQRAATATARARRPDLRRHYGQPLSDVMPGAFEFRLRLLRTGASPLLLDEVVESFSWEDADDVLTGSLSLRRPDPEDAESLPIGVGHRVLCEVRWAGSWYRLWQMRVQPPGVDLPEGTVDVELRDDLVLLDRGRYDWSFRKTKRRKRGWLPQEVTREVARRLNVPIGSIAAGKHRKTRLVKKNASGLAVIREAYGHERQKSGRRFIVRMRDGLLEVLPLRRNEVLYIFREQIESALLTQEQAIRPVTVIVGKGRIGKGSKARKVSVTAESREASRRFGRVEEEKSYGRVASVAELRGKAQRDLAKKLRIRRSARLTLPGVPFVRRGDACRWVTKEAGWHGSSSEIRDRSFVYVRSATHTVAAGEYTMTLDVVQDDPYVKDAERRDREARARARAKRKK